jgi:hypothetical protein
MMATQAAGCRALNRLRPTFHAAGRDRVGKAHREVTPPRQHGPDLVGAAARARETRLSAGLGDRSAEILAYVAANPPHVKAAQVEEKFGREARQYLKRLADTGRLRRLSRGVYTSVTSVTSSQTQVSEPEPGDSAVTSVTSDEAEEQAAELGQQALVTHVTDVTHNQEPDDPRRWSR